MYFQNKFKDKKVAVIGHTGFKGSWLVAWLEMLGAKVAGYSKSVPTTPSHFELANLKDTMIDVRGEIADYKSLLGFLQDFQPDIVFHLGANAIVSDCLTNPQEAFMTNAMGTVNVLEALRHLPSLQAAVIVTSDKCYENVEWEFGYRETDRLGGKDPYSASKACAELIFSSYFRTYYQGNHKFKIASARAGNVIGGGDWATSRIIPDCIRSWTKNEAVKIRNPLSTRPWQHVLEPLSGYMALAVQLLDKETTLNGEAFNFGPKAEVNKEVTALIDEMKKHWDSARYQVEQDLTLHKKEASLLKLCCDKSLVHLSWLPTLSFEETVEMTASWYKNWNENPASVMKFTKEQINYYQNIATERKINWAI